MYLFHRVAPMIRHSELSYIGYILVHMYNYAVTYLLTIINYYYYNYYYY